jgi:opacity protein-like surface antigen
MIIAVLEFDWSVAMRGFLLAAIAFGAVSGAHAADLPFLRGGFTDGYSRAPVVWQGFYVGGQGSWGSQKSAVPGVSDMQATFITPPGVSPYAFGTPLNTVNSLHGGYGGFFGYNAQFEDVVFGVEGNYIHDGFRGATTAFGLVGATATTVASATNSSVTMKLSDFGSLRARGGYMTGCFLPYVFVGLGLGDQTIDRAVSASPPPLAGWWADSKSKLIYGYTAGAGFDVMLTGGLFARAEYEYRRMTSTFESTVNTVRVGLGYKF